VGKMKVDSGDRAPEREATGGGHAAQKKKRRRQKEREKRSQGRRRSSAARGALYPSRRTKGGALCKEEVLSVEKKEPVLDVAPRVRYVGRKKPFLPSMGENCFCLEKPGDFRVYKGSDLLLGRE